MLIKRNRRQFSKDLAGAAIATACLSGNSSAQDAPVLTAAVLEYPDRWTKNATGAAQALAESGFHVVDLDLQSPPQEQPQKIDLLFFGSFTNNGDTYSRYVQEFTGALQSFVESGGVLVEQTQSDQYGDEIRYLPGNMMARRVDADFDVVHPVVNEHPLTAWLGNDGPWDQGFFNRVEINWESFVDWDGLAVLLSSRPNGEYPCLLEGAFGKGRFVLSSLWIDKCADPQGNPYPSPKAVEVSKRYFQAIHHYVHAVKAGRAPAVQPTPPARRRSTGPMIGHVDDQSIRLWFRPAAIDQSHSHWQCRLSSTTAGSVDQIQILDPDHDYTLQFTFDSLEPNTQYQYLITPATPTAEARASGVVQTDLDHDDNDRPVVVSFGSCAPSTPNHVWTTILEEKSEGFVFLGDTPYIDSTDLKVAREKHRQFLQQPEISEMIRTIPCWGTWDDHDFGKNDGHGDFEGKHISRIAFTEYRANRSFGHDEKGLEQRERFGSGRGIYTSFRRGPLEVFLLDPRWFSRTEKSWADDDQPTCLGRTQWDWFRSKLRSSTATFKAITTGMIWDDKTNREKDDWGTYFYERDAIFDFIQTEKISGCFLIGGDIHVSRALRYQDRVGYDLWQFIVSPLHDRTIPQLNVPHPNLVHAAEEPHVFLKLEVDSRSLLAKWINREGNTVFSVTTTAEELAQRKPLPTK